MPDRDTSACQPRAPRRPTERLGGQPSQPEPWAIDGGPAGFAAPGTPELSVGVTAAVRGRGVGTRLLAALLSEARALGHPAVSLSVEPDNHARRLYERSGFVAVGENGGSTTMLLALHDAEER